MLSNVYLADLVSRWSANYGSYSIRGSSFMKNHPRYGTLVFGPTYMLRNGFRSLSGGAHL